MCGRFDTSHLTWREIHDRLEAFLPVKSAPLNLEPNEDVRPTDPAAIARVEDGGWVVEKMRWGLVPWWRNGKPLKDTSKGAGDGFKLTTFNARVEGCATASTFKEAFARRRCIVPASAWYEWTGEPGSKVKHRFARKDGEPVWFAALWDRCHTPDAGDIRSFTILVGPGQGWLADYHDREPVILDPDDWSTWFDLARDSTTLLAAARPERFEIA